MKRNYDEARLPWIAIYYYTKTYLKSKCDKKKGRQKVLGLSGGLLPNRSQPGERKKKASF